MIEITIVDHPLSAAHRIIKVVSLGRVYAATTAEPFPTIAEAHQIWQNERRSFRPYDESSGRYLGGR
jgi:hypothetical protein